MILYMGFIIYGLYEIGLWKIHQLKSTFVWVASVGALSLFQLEKIKSDPQFFKNSIIKNLKLVAVVLFVLKFYKFNLVIELIMIPVFFVLGGALALTQSEKIKNFCNNIMCAFGVGLIVFTIYMLIANFDKFANEKTMYDFITPPLLTLLYLPFIFVMMVLTTYESVFVRLPIAIKDPAVLRFAKRYSVFKFHFRLKLLERWTRLLICEALSEGIISKTRIKESIDALYKILSIEKKPPVVSKDDGWSPYTAKEFLASEGLRTGYYDPIAAEEWFASSPSVKFGDGVFPNQISYSVKGDATIAKELDLCLIVYSRESGQSAHLKLLSCAKILMQKALNFDLTGGIAKAILDGANTSFPIDNFIISLERHDFSKDLGTYEIVFQIAVGRVEE